MKKRYKVLLGLLVIIVAIVSYSKISESIKIRKFEKVDVLGPTIPTWEFERIDNENYIQYKSFKDIVYSTEELQGASKQYYSKYIDYIAPNGKPIRILAQDKVTDQQLLYAYSVLEFFLDNTEALDKSEVANNMADKGAIIVMPNGADRDGAIKNSLIGQPQYQNETANPGSTWYINNDYSHRDSTFEEIFHLVHGYGIGYSKTPLGDEVMSNLIKDAQSNALPKSVLKWGKEGLWGINARFMLFQWSIEKGSLESEYIISVIDAYYGLWEAYDGKGSIYGEYVPKNREEVTTLDPLGLKALEHYLPEMITSMIRIDDSFDGEFKLKFDESNLYTFKSQYYLNAWLQGLRDTNLTGNDFDNILIGNAGNNLINGLDGVDIVQFNGNFSEYIIEISGDSLIFTDTTLSRDGMDTLTNIELFRFRDRDVTIEEMLDLLN